jgi:hypothetical protein
MNTTVRNNPADGRCAIHDGGPQAGFSADTATSHPRKEDRNA